VTRQKLFHSLPLVVFIVLKSDGEFVELTEEFFLVKTVQAE
jgi:hypothetical protein